MAMCVCLLGPCCIQQSFYSSSPQLRNVLCYSSRLSPCVSSISICTFAFMEWKTCRLMIIPFCQCKTAVNTVTCLGMLPRSTTGSTACFAWARQMCHECMSVAVSLPIAYAQSCKALGTSRHVLEIPLPVREACMGMATPPLLPTPVVTPPFCATPLFPLPLPDVHVHV